MAGGAYDGYADQLHQLATHSAGAAHDESKLIEECVKSSRRSMALGANVLEHLAVIDERTARAQNVLDEMVSHSAETVHEQVESETSVWH